MRRGLAIALLALTLVMLRACAWVIESEPGNVLRVVVAPAAWSGGDVVGVLAPGDGSEIRIERAFLVWSRATLVPCAGASSHAVGVLGGGQARAHATSSPFVVERSVVVSLLGHGARELGVLHAPSGHYCRLVLGFDGATPDPVGAPADLPMTGQTLALDGFFRASAGAGWETVALSETASFELALDLGSEGHASDGLLIAGGVELEARLVVAADDWFEGVVPSAPDAARRLLENVRSGLHLELQ